MSATTSKETEIEITFLGTRGEIDSRSRRHRRHSALLVRRGRVRIMIDCGVDWLKALRSVSPTAIILTHAHPDHAFGLAAGAPYPVYATGETWSLIARYPIADRRIITPRKRFLIDGVRFEAFKVNHSIRAPAVGYRVSADGAAFFYAPDLVSILDQRAALHGVDLYIGDGATITRPMVRRRDDTPIGHSPIRTQLGWCEVEAVSRAIFTHCGSEVVKGDGRRIAARVAALGKAFGIAAHIAYDGLTLRLRRRTIARNKWSEKFPHTVS